jgi:hypothetical protein
VFAVERHQAGDVAATAAAGAVRAQAYRVRQVGHLAIAQVQDGQARERRRAFERREAEAGAVVPPAARRRVLDDDPRAHRFGGARAHGHVGVEAAERQSVRRQKAHGYRTPAKNRVLSMTATGFRPIAQAGTRLRGTIPAGL